MTIDEKTAEYLQGLLKLPHVGSRGVDALYQEVKKQGKAYNTKLKSGLTLENIKEWYTSASCRLRNDCVICVNPAITHKGITA